MATDDVKVVVVSAGKTPEDEDSTPVPIAVAATYQAQPIQQGGTVLNGSIGGYSMQATVPSLATMSAAVPSVSVALPGVAMQPAYGGVVGGCAHAQEAVVKRITGLQIMYAVLLLIFFWPLFCTFLFRSSSWETRDLS